MFHVYALVQGRVHKSQCELDWIALVGFDVILTIPHRSHLAICIQLSDYFPFGSTPPPESGWSKLGWRDHSFINQLDLKGS